MLYGVFRGGVPFKSATDIPDQSNRVLFVTGGNIGLGYESILKLAPHNPAHIYLAARSEPKALAAIEAIKKEVPSARISFIACDLADLSSVVACARQFLAQEQRLDLLLCNAGVMALPAGLTKQGYEMQFGTNHMGHALLAKLLMPTLLATAGRDDAADVRVVAVSSVGHTLASKAGLPFADLKGDMQGYGTYQRYGHSKLANILWVRGLEKRVGGKGVLAVSVHPGVVATNLYETTLGGVPLLGGLLKRGMGLVMTGVQGGALNQLWAATAERKTLKGGEYYTPVGVAGNGGAKAYDDELAEKLWAWTEKELDGWTL